MAHRAALKKLGAKLYLPHANSGEMLEVGV